MGLIYAEAAKTEKLKFAFMMFDEAQRLCSGSSVTKAVGAFQGLIAMTLLVLLLHSLNLTWCLQPSYSLKWLVAQSVKFGRQTQSRIEPSRMVVASLSAGSWWKCFEPGPRSPRCPKSQILKLMGIPHWSF